MDQRFDLTKVAPDGYKAMLGVHSYVQNSGLSLGRNHPPKTAAPHLARR